MQLSFLSFQVWWLALLCCYDPAYHRHFGLNEREWMETLDLINWAWVRPVAELATNFGYLDNGEAGHRPSCQRLAGFKLMHPCYYSQVLLNWLEDVMASKIGLFNLLLILVVGALVVTTASQTCPSICTCKWKNGKKILYLTIWEKEKHEPWRRGWSNFVVTTNVGRKVCVTASSHCWCSLIIVEKSQYIVKSCNLLYSTL